MQWFQRERDKSITSLRKEQDLNCKLEVCWPISSLDASSAQTRIAYLRLSSKQCSEALGSLDCAEVLPSALMLKALQVLQPRKLFRERKKKTHNTKHPKSKPTSKTHPQNPHTTDPPPLHTYIRTEYKYHDYILGEEWKAFFNNKSIELTVHWPWKFRYANLWFDVKGNGLLLQKWLNLPWIKNIHGKHKPLEKCSFKLQKNQNCMYFIVKTT